MPFPPNSQVDVRQVTTEDWQLLAALDYDGKSEHFEAPVGMRTDFASVPRIFVWFLPRYGRYTKAAILHDYLCAGGQVERVDADAIFRRAMRELGVPFLRRWIMWAAVRWGALLAPGGTKGWLKESPRVLLVSALALPIVLPPAVVILLAIAAFYVLEMASYLLLHLSEAGRTAIKRPSGKQINMPTPSISL
jgi:hypothetical protein